MSRPLDAAAVDGLRGARVHVVGLAGTEGTAITRFLAARGVTDLHAHDIAEGEALEKSFMQVHVGLPISERERMWQEMMELGIDLRTGADYLRGIEDADVVFASQGWYLYPANHPRLDHVRDAGTPFYGLMHLYFGLAPARTLAVTGSNGKSTTSRLVEHFMKPSGTRVWYAGNERRSVQVLDRIDDMRPEDILVLEVSNRPLIDLQPSPDIAVITNILPNHLSEHGDSFDTYRAVKKRLIERQTPDQVSILNADDEASRAVAEGCEGRILWFSRQRPLRAGAWVHADRLCLAQPEIGESHGVPPFAERRGTAPPPGGLVPASAFDAGPISAMPIPGEHNIENLLAAALAAFQAGVDPPSIGRAIPTFRGLRHRIQFVWAVDGVEYYDDLNATSPQATIAALAALTAGPAGTEHPHHEPSDRRIVLMSGGDQKGLDMSALGEAISRDVRWLVLLPGPGGDDIERAVSAAGGDGVRVDRVDDFATAVKMVMDGATPGERVLLSPACPGFFGRHYGPAGQELGFRALLRTLTRERSDEGLHAAQGEKDHEPTEHGA